MLIPIPWDLVLYPGFKFDPLFVFYTDDARTQAQNLTGYTAQLVIANGALVLTDTAGLTLGGTAGTVQALASGAQTANVPHGNLPWYLEWTPSGGQPDCPVSGSVLVGPPPS